jgi:hypothetical protein
MNCPGGQQLARHPALGAIRGNERDKDDETRLGHEAGDFPDPADVLDTIRLGKPEILVQAVTHVVAIEDVRVIPEQVKALLDEIGDRSKHAERHCFARSGCCPQPRDWEALWKSHAPGQTPPPVDFKTRFVAAAFLGSRPTGGFSVQITGTRIAAGTLIIEFVDRERGPGDIVTQALTSPFHLVTLPRHEGAVRLEKRPQAQ